MRKSQSASKRDAIPLLMAEKTATRQNFVRQNGEQQRLPNGHEESHQPCHIKGQKCDESEITDSSWFVSDELSEGLVLFSSSEGRRIFFEAGHAGYLNSYFDLAQNFLTSSEPRFGCGLATLTMCLNTFRVDPGRVWKDIYRWYSQTLLEHCTPYRIIAHNGLVFQQFACLAECNYLKVAMVCNRNQFGSIEDFRALCKRITLGLCDEILIVCYHRIGLDQEGTGHFSPIGGYHPEKDLVLVFDISRYKYPLHWVPVKRLWEAMALHDDLTGNPRGYFVLRKRESLDNASLLFKTVSPEDSPTFHRGWLTLFKTVLIPWHHWMKSLDISSVDANVILGDVIRKLLQLMMSNKCTGIDHLDGIHLRLEFTNADPSLYKDCLVCEFRETIESCSLWEYVKNIILEKLQQQSVCLCWSKLINEVLENNMAESCCDIKTQPSCCHLRRFNVIHYVVMILLSWPYDLQTKNNHIINIGICSAMNNVISTELSNMNNSLNEEVMNAKNRFLKTELAIYP